MKIKGDHKFRAAKGAAWVPTLTLMDHADDITPYLAGYGFEFLDVRHDAEVGLN
jgi:hypothetical protein